VGEDQAYQVVQEDQEVHACLVEEVAPVDQSQEVQEAVEGQEVHPFRVVQEEEAVHPYQVVREEVVDQEDHPCQGVRVVVEAIPYLAEGVAQVDQSPVVQEVVVGQEVPPFQVVPAEEAVHQIEL